MRGDVVIGDVVMGFESKVKKPNGRPTKYKKEYCEMLIEHMSKGLSFASFAGTVKANVDTLYEWVKVQPNFSDAFKQGQGLRAQYIEGLALQAASGGKGSPQMLIFLLKNLGTKYDFKDKTEQAITAEVTQVELVPRFGDHDQED